MVVPCLFLDKNLSGTTQYLHYSFQLLSNKVLLVKLFLRNDFSMLWIKNTSSMTFTVCLHFVYFFLIPQIFSLLYITLFSWPIKQQWKKNQTHKHRTRVEKSTDLLLSFHYHHSCWMWADVQRSKWEHTFSLSCVLPQGCLYHCSRCGSYCLPWREKPSWNIQLWFTTTHYTGATTSFQPQQSYILPNSLGAKTNNHHVPST